MKKDAFEKEVADLSEFEQLVAEQIIPDRNEFCDYVGKCKKVCFMSYAKEGNCGVFRFYEKYGTDWKNKELFS